MNSTHLIRIGVISSLVFCCGMSSVKDPVVKNNWQGWIAQGNGQDGFGEEFSIDEYESQSIQLSADVSCQLSAARLTTAGHIYAYTKMDLKELTCNQAKIRTRGKDWGGNQAGCYFVYSKEMPNTSSVTQFDIYPVGGEKKVGTITVRCDAIFKGYD